MTYFFVLVGTWITSFLCPRKLKINGKNREGEIIYIVFWAIILVSLCGLRRYDVGRDTSMYYYTYGVMQKRTSLREVFGSYNYFEYGFYLTEYLISRVFSYQVFLVLMAALSIAPCIFLIHKYSPNKFQSVFLYITFPYYTFCMTGIRQACAIGIICLAYDAVREKKLVRYLIFVLLAVLFHTSAILFLPVYWINKIPYKKKTIYLAVAAMIMAYVFKGPLWKLLSVFARQQYSESDAGGQMMYLFMILTVILGFLFRRSFIGEESDNRGILYMQVVAAILWPIASVNPAIARMYYYYHLFFILFVPLLIKSIPEWPIRLIVSTGYYGVGIYFLITQILKTSMMLSPYYFFWQI